MTDTSRLTLNKIYLKLHFSMAAAEYTLQDLDTATGKAENDRSRFERVQFTLIQQLEALKSIRTDLEKFELE